MITIPIMKQTSPRPLENCPSHETLRAYLYGRSDESTSDSIDLHLESCQTCNQFLESLESNEESSSPLHIENDLLAAAIAEAKQHAS